MKACKCGSYAINHHCHGRDGTDGDLCDVCYWRKRAESKDSNVVEPTKQPAHQEPVLMFYEQEWRGKTSRAYQWLIDPFSLPAGTKLYTSPQPAQRKPLTDDLDVKQLNHCMIAVRDWLGGGCDTDDIPRPEIAALVAFTNYSTKENK